MSTKSKRPKSLRTWLILTFAIVGIIVMIIGALFSVLILFFGVMILSLGFFLWLQGIIGQSKQATPGRLRLDLLTEHINPYDALDEMVDYDEADIGRLELTNEQIREAAQVLQSARSKDERTATLRLLMAGAKSVPYLRADLHSTNQQVVVTSLLTLRFFDKDAASAVKPVTGLLESDNVEIRGHSALLLAKIGSAAKEAVPKLLSLLQDTDFTVARDAAIALGMIGVKSDEVVKALKSALDAEELQLRLFSQIGLARLGEYDEASIAFLTNSVNDRDPMNGIFAAQALGQIGTQAKTSEQTILRLLSHRHPALRLVAAQTLHSFQSAPSPIAKALVRNLPLRKAEPFIRRDSFNLLKQIIEEVPEVIPQLTKQVSNRDPVTRLLAKFGPEAIDAAPALLKMMEDQLMTCRYHARQALEKISPSYEDE
ncbi:MAG: HEAT repeat domain-containing protein [Promethearchaeota archaeon]